MMNILLPTDFSENSKNAAAYALQFFKEVPCHFHVLHVIPAKGKVGTGFISTSSKIQKEFDRMLEWLKDNAANNQHEFHVALKANYLIEAVREHVQEKNIDLILMGTKGCSNKGGAIVGKNTSDVMMKVKCPVLAISEKTLFKEHSEILFPTDYKIQYNSKMLEALLNVSSLSKASVKVLELFHSDMEPSAEQLSNRAFLQSAFMQAPLVMQTLYASKNLDSKSIFLENKNVDMIVMAAKNLNICKKLLDNQSQNQIPFINNLPLLILH